MSSPDRPHFPPTAVAVIGMAGRFPGSPDVDAFWHNLADGREGITFFGDDELRAEGVPDDLLSRPDYVRARGVVEGVDRFDASFFNYRARDAELMDPQIRFFLEACWEAMESAGYDTEEYPGSIGVYGGASAPRYYFHHYVRDRSVFEGTNPWQVATLTENDYLTTHVSYRMRLRGPSMNIQTACSTSLVAVHVAAQAVLNGECDMALAGGVSIGVPSRRGYLYDEGHIVSPDGHCRAFDADARGTVEGEGVGVVVLKKLDRALDDGDNVLAVILATAVNNDGEYKAGFLAPGVSGQAEVISEAQAVAGVEPESVTYVEAHGTGTPLGDPIEITALKEAFGGAEDGRAWCAVGAVKTNVGHMDAAAGVAGLIKTVQALRHGQIPPTLHFRAPNPKLGIEGSPFFVADRLIDWTVPGGGPRRAGVSSFGIGGTNAHAVLQQAPPREPGSPPRPCSLLILSARTPRALERQTGNLARWLEAHPGAELADVAYTLQVGRRAQKHRRSVLCRTSGEAVALLRGADPARVRTDLDPYRPTPLTFLFPGQGAQFVGMAREIHAHEPVFRRELERCRELLRPHLAVDLFEVLYPSGDADAGEAEARLRRTGFAQPALFAVEYALAVLWRTWGAQPEAFAGHSIGEYVAACLAGVMSLDDALRLVAARGALMQQMRPGAMLSVSLPERDVREMLPASLDVCAVNGPALTVVGGMAEEVDAFAAEMEGRDIHHQRLRTSHAFHSRTMDHAVARFEQVVRGVTLRAPELPFLSNLTGGWISDAQATDPRYWAEHLRATVRWDDNLRVLMAEPDRVLLEVGPGRGLATLARRHPARDPKMLVLHSLAGPKDDAGEEETLWSTVAELWHVGIEPDWPRLYDGLRRLRLRLPTYPWDHGRYWLGVRDVETQEQHEYVAGGRHAIVPVEFSAPRNEYEAGMVEIFRELFGLEQLGIYHNFFQLGGDSLLAVQLARRIRDRFGVAIPLRAIWEIRTVSDVALLVARAVDADGSPSPLGIAEAEPRTAAELAEPQPA
jgi:acyl transferase domain-containing protein/acyl carrier protein